MTPVTDPDTARNVILSICIVVNLGLIGIAVIGLRLLREEQENRDPDDV